MCLLLFVSILSLLSSVLQIILWPILRILDPNQAYNQRLNGFLCELGCLPFFSIQVNGLENFPTDRGCIMVANHQSALDAFIFTAMAHINFKVIFKSEILFYPGIGSAMWLAGHLPLKRGDKNSGAAVMAKTKQLLSEGVSVLYFPEATRKIDVSKSPIGPFKAGAFKTAIEAGALIVPITISGARYLMPPHGVPKLGWGNPTLTVHPPIDTAGCRVSETGSAQKEDVDTLAEQAREVIASALTDADSAAAAGSLPGAK